MKKLFKILTTLTRADVAATLQVYGEVCSSLIKDGSAVNTPLFNTALTIAGVFNGANDAFDKKRHTVNLNINAGTALKTAVGKVKTIKTETASTDPYITSVLDKLNGSSDEVKIGFVMEIIGSRLKFDPKDDEQGVFAVSGTKTVRCASVVENKPARIIVLLDASVPAGDFTLEVRTKLSSDGSKKSKTLKKGYYRKTLKAVV